MATVNVDGSVTTSTGTFASGATRAAVEASLASSSAIEFEDASLAERRPVIEKLEAEIASAQEIAVAAATAEDLERYADVKTMNLGKEVVNDWDDELIIVDLYEDFLRAVQLGKCSSPLVVQHVGRISRYDLRANFARQWLPDCLKTLQWQREEKLPKERAKGYFTPQSWANALTLVDITERAIRKYLEKSPRLQLIGV